MTVGLDMNKREIPNNSKVHYVFISHVCLFNPSVVCNHAHIQLFHPPSYCQPDL